MTTLRERHPEFSIDRSWVVWTIASMEEALLLQRILRWMPLAPSPREGAGRRPDRTAAYWNPEEEVAKLRARVQMLEEALSLQNRREHEEKQRPGTE